ncbi:MAG: alpha/beta hydrolase [Verrucomicrobiota bacterium]
MKRKPSAFITRMGIRSLPRSVIFFGSLLLFLQPWAMEALQIDSATLLPNHQLRLGISGATNSICIIEASTNLAGWTTVTNIFNPTGAFQFTNALGTNPASRFFRVRSISQIPATQSKNNVVRIVPANSYGGTLSTTVTYQPTTAVATATTGNTILLAKGFEFRLTTVVGYHAFGEVPTNLFLSRDVDTRLNSGNISTSAPTVIYTNARPVTGEAHFTPYVQVTYKDTASGKYLLYSHSWPDSTLQGAGISIAAQNQTNGAPLPPSETTELDGAFAGLIDSGEPDGLACGTIQPATGALPAGLVTNHAGFANAPAYYEIGAPTGASNGLPPRGIALLIHGGGWVIAGPGAAESLRSTADRWRARGFQTVNISYRPGGLSVTDALWFFDHVRSTYGPTIPIVTMGQSAGGHLALVVASYRTNVYAAISQAGPTDLAAIATQPAYDTTTGGSQTNAGRWVHNLGSASFGVENLELYNVVGRAANLTNTRILQGFALNDSLVSTQQATTLQTAILAVNPGAYVDTDLMANGTIQFVHGFVSTAANNDFITTREQNLISTLPP